MAIPADQVKCMFFSEFDPIAGPKISFQVIITKPTSSKMVTK